MWNLTVLMQPPTQIRWQFRLAVKRIDFKLTQQCILLSELDGQFMNISLVAVLGVSSPLRLLVTKFGGHLDNVVRYESCIKHETCLNIAGTCMLYSDHEQRRPSSMPPPHSRYLSLAVPS